MQSQTEDISTIGQYDAPARLNILKAAIAHENAVNPRANIHVIEASQLVDFVNSHQDQERYQLIIGVGVHYFTVDILQKDGLKSCIVLDAANDYKCNAPMEALVKNGFTATMATGLSEEESRNVQSDGINCTMFALDHAIQLTHTSDELHSELHNKSNFGGFTWDCLPPPFLRNTQSTRFLKGYMQEMGDNIDRVTQQYIQEGFKTYHKDDDEPYTHNESINIHVFQRAERIYQKQQILIAMQGAIDKVSNSIVSSGKNDKRNQLQEIKHNFEKMSVEDALNSPLQSPLIQAFENAAATARLTAGTPKSAAYFRQQLGDLRAEQPNILQVDKDLDSTSKLGLKG